MVFARLLDPIDFGLIGMVAAVTGVIGLLKDFGLSTATVQRDGISEEQISTLFWFNLLLGLVLWFLCAAIAPVLVRFYNEPRLFWITIALAAGFFFTAAGVQHSALLQRQMRFGALAAIEVLALAFSTVTGLVMAAMGFGYWSLVGWSVALPFGNCLGVWATARWLPGLPRREVEVRSLLGFGGLVTLNVFVMQIAFNLDKVLLGRVWGAEVLGLYGRAYQLTSMATDNLLSAIGSVAFPALSRVQNDAARLENYFLKGYKLVFTMALPASLACVLFSEDIVLVLLGAKWREVTPILLALGPSIAIYALLHPLGWFLYSLGLVRRSLFVSLAILPLVTIGYVAGLPFGATGVAAGFTIALAVWVVPHLFWCTWGLQLSPWSLLRTTRSPFAAGVVAAVASYAVHAGLGAIGPIARLIVETVVFLLTYASVLLWILREKDFYLDLVRVLRGSGVPSARSDAV
jgi:PST family polysaccharide transporter